MNPKEIGRILKEARQKKALSPDKIYKLTRLQPHVITALEEGVAHERLGRVYVTLLLKKYASILELDGESLAADYKKFYKDDEKQIFNLEKKTTLLSGSDDTRKWVVLAVSVLVAAFAVILVFLMASGLKTVLRARREAPKAAAETRVPKIDFKIPRNKPIEVSLQSSDDVWMKAVKDGTVVFEGTLKKNKRITWSAENNIKLWVGRAEALTLTLNGRSVGKLGYGTIKDIQITREGLKVGDKPLVKTEE